MTEQAPKTARIQSDDVAGSARFRVGLARVATESGRPLDSVTDEARKYLEELRTGHSDAIYRRWIESGRRLLGVGYSQIDYDAPQVERLRGLLARYPAVILSSHRSYLDGGAINVGFYDRGLPNLISFPGINMAFWPLNHIWRRCNAVFIRRGGTGPVYRYVLREFLGYLVEQRRHMTWFIEGTRSRTGKLGPPRLGLLGNVVDGYREGRTEDLLLIPVSVSYDQLREAEEYAGEGRGAAKKAESLGWLVSFVRAQRGRYGTIYVRFGEPVSVREALGPPTPGTAARNDTSKLALQKLAFEVSWRINQASPITGTSLVTLTLLAARGVAMTALQIQRSVQGYLAYARRRGLPMAPTAALDSQQAVMETLTALEGSGVLNRYAAGTEAVYSVGADEYLAASYYRNSIIHFFLLPAIAELALLQAAEAPAPERPAAFWDCALELRDLLKFEFFFQEKDEFKEALASELGILAPDWVACLARGTEGVRELLNRIAMLSSDMMLRSFIEAYLVLANALAGRADAAAVDETAFLGECMALGQQYLLQRRIRNPESVSRHLFQTGVQLARNRGLWEAGEGVSVRRREFAARLTELARHMRTVNKVAVHRLEQETGSEAG